MKVKLLNYTKDGERLIAQAAKLCYSQSGVDEIEKKLDPEEIERFLENLMKIGHFSPIEHVSFTFAIEGVSRTLSHQLVRHRLASYSQQSQRYVKLDQFDYIIPPAIDEDKVSRDIFIKAMEEDQENYNRIVDRLKSKYLDEGMKESDGEKKAIEDARYIFPNACETKVVFTMNARTLMNFLTLRTCNRAQWEIRQLAIEMLKEVRKVYPILFKKAGPGCVAGPCPEGSMTCGKIVEVREMFKNI